MRREGGAPVHKWAQLQVCWLPVSLQGLQVKKNSGRLAQVLAHHLALVWCLKPLLVTAAGAAGAVGAAGFQGLSFWDGPAVAEEAEAAALESG